jgi:hypothetical protein
MLEPRKELVDRIIARIHKGETQISNQYIIPSGSSKAIDEIYVSYTSHQGIVRGDTSSERETVDLSFRYPTGRSHRNFRFEAIHKNYGCNLADSRQGKVPDDVLEVLADALPLEVRRLLPALSKK